MAILEDEPERDHFEQLIASNECFLSAVSYFEASVVLLHRRGEGALALLDTWIKASEITIMPFTQEQAEFARTAYSRFGKGRHPAGLNFGDCASYALAMIVGEALLFKGNDFVHTDVPKIAP